MAIKLMNVLMDFKVKELLCFQSFTMEDTMNGYLVPDIKKAFEINMDIALLIEIINCLAMASEYLYKLNFIVLLWVNDNHFNCYLIIIIFMVIISLSFQSFKKRSSNYYYYY